jgi:diamine N-acetyltransferase
MGSGQGTGRERSCTAAGRQPSSDPLYPARSKVNVASYRIRKATTSDAEELSGCLESAFKAFRGEYTFAAFRDTVPTASEMVRRLAEMCLFVAVAESGEIVGTLGYRMVDEEEAHLRGMAVAPKYQGSGIAQRLLDAVESELHLRRCLRISLNTTQPLKRAVSFYEKNGYRPSGRVSDFFGMPLYEFTKTLTQAAPAGRTV